MPNPLDEIKIEIDCLIERAAIMEFGGGMSGQSQSTFSPFRDTEMGMEEDGMTDNDGLRIDHKGHEQG